VPTHQTGTFGSCKSAGNRVRLAIAEDARPQDASFIFHNKEKAQTTVCPANQSLQFDSITGLRIRNWTMHIKDRVFLVTGAGSGLGAAVARQLVSAGGFVVCADINRTAGESVAQEVGANVRFIATDVTSEADGQAAVKFALDTFGHLHGLINCAGVARGEKVVGRENPHRLESFAKTVAINLVGTFNMIRLAAEVIVKEDPGLDGERGVVINTASIAAFDGQIGQAAYAASKAGVVGLTLPVARELARYGVRVVTIAPGIFETPMMAAMPQDVQDSLGQSVPFPSRLGRPPEYAALVVHICENVMLNGEVIRLDGALRLPPR
jgi:NAD(P)-dependent dehydrogenase (short-subunit alcohol dehydrogenase family)